MPIHRSTIIINIGKCKQAYARHFFHRPTRKVTFNSDPIRIDSKREVTQQPPPPHSEAHTGPRPAQPTAFSRAPLVVAPSERTEQLARPRKVTPKFPMQTTVAFGRTVHVDDSNKERVGRYFKCVVCILIQQESPVLGLASLQSERNVVTANKLSNTNKMNAKQPTVTAVTKKAAECGMKASNGNTRSRSPVVVSPTPAQMRDESLQTISSTGSDPVILELKDMVSW